MSSIVAVAILLSFTLVNGCYQEISRNHMMAEEPDDVINHQYNMDSVLTPWKKVKRSVSDSSLHEPYDANQQTLYVELILVIDNGVYKNMNKNLNRIHDYCKNLVKIVNLRFDPLNISIALVDVVVWTEKDKIEISKDVKKTVDNFKTYRNSVLFRNNQKSYVHLLTSKVFNNNTLGVSYLQSSCTIDSCGFSRKVGEIKSTAATLVHEIGHSLGVDHDTSACECDDEKCLMTERIESFVPSQWSSCSINTVETVIHKDQGINHCLKNVPKYLFDSPTCGNGFVEKGEECDCGLPSVCKNSCCDPVTCKLESNATCGSGKCCDFRTCQPHKAGFVCRSSAGACDIPESCNGNSEFCPLDNFEQDGSTCEGNIAYNCSRGSCKLRNFLNYRVLIYVLVIILLLVSYYEYSTWKQKRNRDSSLPVAYQPPQNQLNLVTDSSNLSQTL